MMVENNYYSIACNDYRYLLRNLDSDFYNNMAVACQQIVEKLLKSVLVHVNPNAKNLLNLHNLRQIYNAINVEEKFIKLNVGELSLLNDYYELRYPGDNFTNVTHDEFKSAYEIVIDVFNEVNKWRVKHGFDIEVPEYSLKSKQILLDELKMEESKTNIETNESVKSLINAANILRP